MSRKRLYELKAFLSVRAQNAKEADEIAGRIIDEIIAKRHGDPDLVSVSLDDGEPYLIDGEDDDAVV
jgi:hypothetical protein